MKNTNTEIGRAWRDMNTSEFDYELPKEFIAQDPVSDRASSRLMVLDRETGETVHRKFYEIKDYLKAGDCLVLNDTKVIPARLIGKRADTDGKIELLLLKRHEDDTWECLAKPGRRARPGMRFVFGASDLEAEIVEVLADGNRMVKFYYDGIFEEVLDRLGEMPLPPYITHKLEDRNRYQTVYARYEGSAAAPTAGLHFTNELLDEISHMGVNIAKVTLHVGLGTFRPMKTEVIEEHHMHSEYYNISEEAARTINETKKTGGRIICVGTTSLRTIESAADENGMLRAVNGDTDIFIYPGYTFRITDALITNFHLPKSTLLMLVSALAGSDNIMRAYEEAKEEKYRFLSFGDAMLIL